jgi:L-ascorbate metabolism protein UlaG (beta-lactamase superfamily)
MKHGPVYHWHLDLGGVKVLHVDSADFYDEHLAEADVLLLCAAGHQYRKDYVKTLIERVKPRVVLPCHWDDFSVPIEAPVRQLPGVNVEDFIAQVRATGTRAVLLAPLQSWYC